MNILPNWIRNWYLGLIQPLINLFIERKLNPNWFTTLGLIISIIAAYFFALGHHRIGGAIFLLAGTLDIIDGKVARASNRVTKFGALYDSTLDRYAEMFVLFGIVYYYAHLKDFYLGQFDLSLLGAVAAAVALGGSIMVSYIRARAEGLGLTCSVGLMQRPERIVYLSFSAIFHRYALFVVLILIAVFSNFTAVQRIIHVRKQTLGNDKLSK